MRHMHGRPLLAVVVLAIALLVAACGGGRGGGVGGGGTPAPKLYTVSGKVHVKGAPDDGIANVEITFGGVAASVTTNEDGLWSRDGLTGDVIVTPKHEDFRFTPETQLVTKATTNVNFQGEPAYTASGKIEDDDGDPIEGVDVNFGAAAPSVQTDEDGRWTRTGLIGDVTVTPSDPAYTFTSGTVSEDDPTLDFQGEMKACNEGDATDMTNPCTMTRVKQLQGMGLSGHYALGGDIDASATKEWDNGQGFKPIGASSPNADMFKGTFDGRNHTITGLFINQPTESGVGLFGGVSSTARIENVTLVDVDVTGNENTGGLIGSNSGGVVNNVSISGSVAGGGSVGGLIGRNSGSGTVSGSDSSGTVHGTGGTVGGLVGYNYGSDARIEMSHSDATVKGGSRIGGLVGLNSGTIEHSSSGGSVEGDGNVGGLVGQSSGTISDSYSSSPVSGAGTVGGLVGWVQENGAITASYSTGAVSSPGNKVGGLVGENAGSITVSHSTSTVTGNNDVGGLVGRGHTGAIETSYSTGLVQGEERVGGLVGIATNVDPSSGSIKNSYSLSSVTGTNYVGGLIGTIGFPLENSFSAGLVVAPSEASHVGGAIGSLNQGYGTEALFWDVDASGQSSSKGGTGVLGKSTADMQKEATFTDANWDFAGVWQIDEDNDYPDLQQNPRN